MTKVKGLLFRPRERKVRQMSMWVAGGYKDNQGLS